MDAPDTREMLRDALPISGGLAALELGPSTDEEDREGERLTMRLILWEEHEGQRQVRDIKEQQVWVGGSSKLDPTRLALAVAGWRAALEQLFNQSASSWLEALMPSDLMVSFVDLVALKRPRTAEDFAEALLTSKQRFGRWLKE